MSAIDLMTALQPITMMEATPWQPCNWKRIHTCANDVAAAVDGARHKRHLQQAAQLVQVLHADAGRHLQGQDNKECKFTQEVFTPEIMCKPVSCRPQQRSAAPVAPLWDDCG